MNTFHPDAHYFELADKFNRGSVQAEASLKVAQEQLHDLSVRVNSFATENEAFAATLAELEIELTAEKEKRVSSEPDAICAALKRFFTEDPKTAAADLRGLVRKALEL